MKRKWNLTKKHLMQLDGINRIAGYIGYGDGVDSVCTVRLYDDNTYAIYDNNAPTVVHSNGKVISCK